MNLILAKNKTKKKHKAYFQLMSRTPEHRQRTRKPSQLSSHLVIMAKYLESKAFAEHVPGSIPKTRGQDVQGLYILTEFLLQLEDRHIVVVVGGAKLSHGFV